jgi:hypothetical protein
VEESSAELDASQSCLQQLPPDDQFSDPHFWDGPIVTACDVKASSKAEGCGALETSVGRQISTCTRLCAAQSSSQDKLFLQNCDPTKATHYHAIYVSLSHFDMSSHLFCTDQKASKGFFRLSQLGILLRCSAHSLKKE